jgi:hypothetical protein
LPAISDVNLGVRHEYSASNFHHDEFLRKWKQFKQIMKLNEKYCLLADDQITVQKSEEDLQGSVLSYKILVKSLI